MKRSLCWECLYEHPKGYPCGPYPGAPKERVPVRNIFEDIEAGVNSLRLCLVDHRADEAGRYTGLRNQLIDIKRVMLEIAKGIKRHDRSLTKKLLEALGERDSD